MFLDAFRQVRQDGQTQLDKSSFVYYGYKHSWHPLMFSHYNNNSFKNVERATDSSAKLRRRCMTS